MRRFALAAALAVGCAASVAHVHVAVELTGPGAAPPDLERCTAAVRQAGGVVDPQSGMHALVTLEPNANRVQVLSNRRGLVHDQLEPQASVEQLCRDALAAAATATRREPLPDTGGDQRAHSIEAPPTTATTSGAPTHGPISDQ
jgi:uncharacterized protein (DUF849 family)